MKRLATVVSVLMLLLTSAAAVIPATPAAAAELAGDTVYYKIVNRASGRLLSVLNGGTGEGDDLIVYDDVNASDQLWTIEDADLGYQKFVNKRSGRALSMTDGATANGTLAHLWHYLSTAPDQDWTISPSSAGPLLVLPKYPRKAGCPQCTIPGMTTASRSCRTSDNGSGSSGMLEHAAATLPSTAIAAARRKPCRFIL